MKEIMGLIRHALTTGGGYFIAAGQVDAAQVESIVGGVMTLIGVVWSYYDKKRQKGGE